MNNNNDKSIIVIPARFASTRFPAKVLAKLGGKPIIQWVNEKASASTADKVYVATDHPEVFDTVKKFGGNPVMTSPDHPSGTDRIWEVIKDIEVDIIINVQGDEPLIPHEAIDQLIDTMKNNPQIEMATIGVPRPREILMKDPNMVKVILDNDNFALYFSRSMIPYLREGGNDVATYHHWGIYAYRKETLAEFVKLPSGKLEDCEKLEQLRALENGIRIYVLISNFESIGIDTPEDLLYAEKKLIEIKGSTS